MLASRRMPKVALMSGFEKPPPSAPNVGKGRDGCEGMTNANTPTLRMAAQFGIIAA